MRNSTFTRLLLGGLLFFVTLAAPAADGLNPFAATSQPTAVMKKNGFAASNFSIAGSVTGTPVSLTVKATIQAATADVGVNGSIYAMARIAGLWFFKGAAGSWTLWSGGAFPPPYFQGKLGSHTVDIVQNMDLSAFPDAEFYVGYGLNEADMVANKKYQLINSKPASLLGVWQMTSVSGTFFDNAPQSLLFDADGNMGHFGACAFSANYKVSGNLLAIVVTANDGSAYCGHDDIPGTAHDFTFTLSGDTLTLTANDPVKSTATFQKSFSATPVGTWNLLYSTDFDMFPLGNTFTLDANGKMKVNDAPCSFEATSTFGDTASILRAWTITVVSNNGRCGPENAPGSIMSGEFIVMGNILYIWTDGALAVFQRVG